MQLQDQKAVSRNDPEHGRFLRLALSELAPVSPWLDSVWLPLFADALTCLRGNPVADATAATVLAGSRSLNLSNGVAAVVFEAWRQIGALVAAP
jgi:hypothetical protein